MLKVHGVMKLENGMPVLICDLFQDNEVTNKLSTDIGEFSENEFAIGQIRSCFGPPKTRTILLRTHEDCSKIKNISFV